ncbi:MAG: hypothetical protein L0I24_06410, partial [Pseudonocardia sp.]|nr:hypothetical protein [Pseudonocardia sp.]
SVRFGVGDMRFDLSVARPGTAQARARLLGDYYFTGPGFGGDAASGGLRLTSGLAFGPRDGTAVLDPTGYAGLLSGAGAQVDAWETTYLQRLTGDDPVLQWISATALRPVRDALAPADYARFHADLAPRLRAAYPARPDGSTWFPFRRIFAVARAG